MIATPSLERLDRLDRLVGTWSTDATHPEVPGVVVHGTVVIEWLEGERFLIHRARTDHPDFPDSISIIGFTERDRVDNQPDSDPAVATESPMSMHYFDSRGVFRVFDVSIDDEAWRLWRDAPGFSQKFIGTFADGGDTIAGRWQLCLDDIHWNDDLQIAYRRRHVCLVVKNRLERQKRLEAGEPTGLRQLRQSGVWIQHRQVRIPARGDYPAD